MKVVSFWFGYLVIAALVLIAVTVATRRLRGHWGRHAVVCLVLALFFAPSYFIRGHGVGPALFAAVDSRSLEELAVYGAAPILVAWAVTFAVIRLFFTLSRRPQE
jgi:hypothetical protein